jgi:ParB family chromosome partitioning protein
MSKKRGLGKGISALIPDLDEGIIDAKEGILQVSIDEIKTNPFQSRKTFPKEKIDELASSIKEKGILQPLLVRKDESGYEIIAGERRLRAAYKIGLSTVPVIVREADERTQQEIALIENIQREDLNVIEEAEAYESLIERFNYTQEEVSQKVGKSRTAVTNALRLLKLGKNIKEDLLQNRITMGHARAYLGAESSAVQAQVHRKVTRKGLSVRQTENLIKKLKTGEKEKGRKKDRSLTDQVQYDFILDELRKRFATKVNVIRKGNKGKIVIEFYSNEEFERIYALLRG